jgi:hypothetical protein
MESPYDRHEQPGGFPTVGHFYTLEDLQLFTSFGYVNSNFIRGWWYPFRYVEKVKTIMVSNDMLKKAIKMTEVLFLVNIFRCIIFASIIRTKKYR